MTMPNHNAFVLQAWRGTLTLTINGATVFCGQTLDQRRVSDGTGSVHYGIPFTVAYRRLQLRRLTGTPPAQN